MTNFLILGATGFVGRSRLRKAGRAFRRRRRPDPRRHAPRRHARATCSCCRRSRLAERRRSRRREPRAHAARHRRGDQPRRHPARQRKRVRARPRATAAAAGRRPAATRACAASSTSARSARPSTRRAATCARRRAAKRLLRAAGLELTVLRPSVIFGERDRFLNLFAELQSIFPVMPLAGTTVRFQPVWVDDVATAIARSVDDPSTIGLTIECCGPRVYTLKELVKLAGTWSGNPRPVLALPTALGKLQALVMELLPGKTLMSRDNLDSMRSPTSPAAGCPGSIASGRDDAARRGRAALPRSRLRRGAARGLARPRASRLIRSRAVRCGSQRERCVRRIAAVPK